jgi:hypothetical protein
MSERLDPTIEQIEFNSHLRTFAQILTSEKIDYSLVGGLALKATLGETITPRRKNGTLVDFDAVAFGPSTQKISETITAIQHEKGVQIVFPDVGIEGIEFSDTTLKHSNRMMLSSMRKNSFGEYFLVYRDIEVKIPSETMVVHPRMVNGVEFPCFSAKTLLYRYLIRGGIAKEKDLDKLTGLCDYIYNHENENPSDELYVPYLEFAEKIREKSPHTIKLYDAYWSVDHALGNRISGSTGFLYGLIKLFRG